MVGLLPKKAMTLKQFMVYQQVIKLYRDILKTIREVPDKQSQQELKEWARQDFRNNKHHTDEYTIKRLIKNGEQSLKELRQSIDLKELALYRHYECQPCSIRSPMQLISWCFKDCSKFSELK